MLTGSLLKRREFFRQAHVLMRYRSNSATSARHVASMANPSADTRTVPQATTCRTRARATLPEELLCEPASDTATQSA
jgi:hypothetical protein